MNQTETRIIDIIIGGIPEVPCEGIDECSVVVTMARMDNQTGRLVHHKHIAVFIYNIEGNILSDDLKFIARAIHNHLHHIKGLHAVVTLHSFAVDEYTPGFGCLLHAVTRRFLESGHKEFIDPQELLALVGDKAEVLVVLRAADIDYLAFFRALVFREKIFCHRNYLLFVGFEILFHNCLLIFEAVEIIRRRARAYLECDG